MRTKVNPLCLLITILAAVLLSCSLTKNLNLEGVKSLVQKATPTPEVVTPAAGHWELDTDLGAITMLVDEESDYAWRVYYNFREISCGGEDSTLIAWVALNPEHDGEPTEELFPIEEARLSFEDRLLMGETVYDLIFWDFSVEGEFVSAEEFSGEWTLQIDPDHICTGKVEGKYLFESIEE